jgi:hypothetical protein
MCQLILKHFFFQSNKTYSAQLFSAHYSDSTQIFTDLVSKHLSQSSNRNWCTEPNLFLNLIWSSIINAQPINNNGNKFFDRFFFFSQKNKPLLCVWCFVGYVWMWFCFCSKNPLPWDSKTLYISASFIHNILPIFG